MTKATSWLVMSIVVLAAVLVQAAEPGGGVPDATAALLGDIEKAEKAEAQAATLATAKRYRWDGKESVADYAKRVGIKDVQTQLDLGGGGWWSPPSHCNAYGANGGHGPGGVLGGWGCRVVVAMKDVP